MRNLSRFLAPVLLAATYSLPASAWWCQGHEAVALISEHHLTPDARAQVERLLNSVPSLNRQAARTLRPDPIAIASTWADDAQDNEQTASWHLINIPMSLKKGDPESFCQPVGLAMQTAYGDLTPPPPAEAPEPAPNCDAKKARLSALHIKIDDAYQRQAMPVIEMQIATAGYRLAAVLDAIWP